jgi:UDP-3-O-[3-hydroxymyristoyl] glucosamine N-acyltransferase
MKMLLLIHLEKIEEAKEGQLTFLANPKYEEFLYGTKASVVIINEAYEPKKPITATLIRVPDAYLAFAMLLGKYQEIITPAAFRYPAALLYFQNGFVWRQYFYRRLCLPRRKCTIG